MSGKFPWWASRELIDAALTIPCPKCRAERGKQCDRGYPHAARCKNSLAAAKVKEESKRSADEWNAMSEKQKDEVVRRSIDKMPQPKL